MKIGVDLRPLYTGSKYRGVGIYTRETITKLLQIDKENEFRYMDEFKANEDYYRSLLEKYYYTRIGRYKCACSMEHVKEDIEMLLSNGIISETRANLYKKMFEIKEEHGLSGTFVIGG